MDIGDPLEEESKVIHLLASLPDSYNTILTAMEAQDKIPSWDMVTEKLLNEEQKTVSKRSIQIKDENQALVGMTNNAVYSKKIFKCYHCGKPGHIKKNCRLWKKQEDESKNVSRAHTAKAGTSRTTGDDADSDSCGMLATLLTAADTMKSWIVDSGASRHMCGNVTCFERYLDLQNPIDIQVGDGRVVKATGIGSVNLNVKLLDDSVCDLKLRNVLFVPKLHIT